MPHKRNPIISERICGIARVIRANSLVGLENVALWHERDISHSSAERVVLPDSSTGLDYILQKAIGLIDGLVVYPGRMLENLKATKGLIFSGQLLLALTNKGLSRETAYDSVQRNAMRVWDENRDLRELVKADADIKSQLSTRSRLFAGALPAKYRRDLSKSRNNPVELRRVPVLFSGKLLCEISQHRQLVKLTLIRLNQTHDPRHQDAEIENTD